MKMAVIDPMRNGINIMDHLPNQMSAQDTQKFKQAQLAEVQKRKAAAEKA